VIVIGDWGDDMERLPLPKMAVDPAKSPRLTENGERWNVAV